MDDATGEDVETDAGDRLSRRHAGLLQVAHVEGHAADVRRRHPVDEGRGQLGQDGRHERQPLRHATGHADTGRHVRQARHHDARRRAIPSWPSGSPRCCRRRWRAGAAGSRRRRSAWRSSGSCADAPGRAAPAAPARAPVACPTSSRTSLSSDFEALPARRRGQRQGLDERTWRRRDPRRAAVRRGRGRGRLGPGECGQRDGELGAVERLQRGSGCRCGAAEVDDDRTVVSDDDVRRAQRPVGDPGGVEGAGLGPDRVEKLRAEGSLGAQRVELASADDRPSPGPSIRRRGRPRRAGRDTARRHDSGEEEEQTFVLHRPFQRAAQPLVAGIAEQQASGSRGTAGRRPGCPGRTP